VQLEVAAFVFLVAFFFQLVLQGLSSAACTSGSGRSASERFHSATAWSILFDP